MEINILNISGKETGAKVTLEDSVFGIDPNDHAIYLDVKQYLANQRQGTHKSKERNEIAGSTRKLHKQKGTGGSRKGSITNPLYKGGGRIFGPRPRDYSFKLNKKLKSLARKSALSYKAKENNIVILEDFQFSAIKTSTFIDMLKSLNLKDSKNLIVLAENDHNLFMSCRNVQRNRIMRACDLNTYDLLNAGKLVMTAGAIKIVEEAFSK